MAETTKTLHCSVITPERQILECDASSVVLTAHDGEVGFLAHRAPLLCKLGVGAITIVSGGSERRYFLDGGFAQMLHNELIVLTQRAEPADAIDKADAEAELRKAQALAAPDADSRRAKDLALARARARKRVAASERARPHDA